MLAQVLSGLPASDDPNVLVGTATADDAGVYRLSAELALVQTVDFFTPIVDDPAGFGRIAAANALSDIYAMGARPVSALAIAAFPDDAPTAVLADILRGGIEKAREAGISVIGGHTVKDAEPKYGLAVTGVVHPDRIVRNSTAQAGDALLLTKRIGTGILATARKNDRISEADFQPAQRSMEMLNRAAAEIMVQHNAGKAPKDRPVRAATDITGFGLIGHLQEVARGAGVGITLAASSVPFLGGVLALALADCIPSGSRANYAAALAAGVRFSESLPEHVQRALCDAQTSGGLLLCVRAEMVAELLQALHSAGVHEATVVGNVSADPVFAVI